jgi:hypothetical protein
VGRPVEQSINDDELFHINNDTPAVPVDPSLPRIKTGIAFDKQLERFKYEPENSDLQNLEGQAIIMPEEIKELPKAKVFVNIGK